MKTEYILWIVICVIYVVSVILKSRRAAAKKGDEGTVKKPPTWIEKLNKFVSQLQQADRNEYVFEDPEPVWEEDVSETTDQAMEEPPLSRKSPPRVKAQVKSPEPAVSGKEIPAKNLVYGIPDLRKAVIWSEILAPPLALRDK